MRPVTVVTDTTAYLPPGVAESNQLELVSLYVNHGTTRTVREIDMVDLDAFYDEMRSAEELPTTSQPSVGDFTQAYEPLLAAGEDVVSVHISSGLSGTCDSARQAAEALAREGKGGERIRVVDSQVTAGGLGLIAIGTARHARAGNDLDAVAERADALCAGLKTWFVLDTLEYLKRSGRVGGVSAWIGSTLKVKPVVTIQGEVRPVERVRTSKRAFERLVDYAQQRHDSGADAWTVQHIQAPEQAERLVERCREVFRNEPVFVSEIGAVVGTHTGPGLLGVAGVPSELMA